jgi:hypothetical protein
VCAPKTFGRGPAAVPPPHRGGVSAATRVTVARDDRQERTSRLLLLAHKQKRSRSVDVGRVDRRAPSPTGAAVPDFSYRSTRNAPGRWKPGQPPAGTMRARASQHGCQHGSLPVHCLNPRYPRAIRGTRARGLDRGRAASGSRRGPVSSRLVTAVPDTGRRTSSPGSCRAGCCSCSLGRSDLRRSRSQPRCSCRG